MKTKTSLSLSGDVLAELDLAIGPEGNRSAFVETLIKRYFRDLRRAERDRRDAEIYARMARDPDFESDVLDYSIDFAELGDDASELLDEASLHEAG